MSCRMQKTCVVEWARKKYIPKYERYEQRRTKIKVHNPSCIDAKEGDIVKIMECRPISKTKNFVIIEKLGAEKGFKARMEAIESSKVEPKKTEETKAEEEKEEQNAST